MGHSCKMSSPAGGLLEKILCSKALSEPCCLKREAVHPKVVIRKEDTFQMALQKLPLKASSGIDTSVHSHKYIDLQCNPSHACLELLSSEGLILRAGCVRLQP